MKKTLTIIIIFCFFTSGLLQCRKEDPVPIADFTADATILYLNLDGVAALNMIDKSSGNPTFWNWKVTGRGNTFTSADQNPVFALSDTGYYSVALTVGNSNGSSTKTMENFVHVRAVRMNYNYINAGDSTDANYLFLGTIINTISPGGLMEILQLDLNNDAVNDIKLTSFYASHYGQTLFLLSSQIELLNNCQVQIDDTLQRITSYHKKSYPNGNSTTTSYYYLQMKTPRPLETNDRIDSEGKWEGHNSYYFSYSFDDAIYNVYDTIVRITSVYPGWSGHTNKYIGFRIIVPNDTLYGWMQVNITGYKAITIKDIAYR